MSDATTQQAPENLRRLAEAHGVTTQHWDFHGNPTSPSRQTLLKVLEALGVSASTDEEIDAALVEAELAPWRRTLPPTVVARSGQDTPIPVHLPDGAPLRAVVRFADGGERELGQGEDWTPAREVDGINTGQATVLVPGDIPLGYHEVVAYIGDSWAGEGYEAVSPLIMVPGALELPSKLGGRGWGVAAQLYSVRSRSSWGVGDADDLTELLSFLGDEGADFLLINPLHAGEPTGHLTPSPYLPVTRRFVSPLYIRPENIVEVARLSGPRRSLVQWGLDEVEPMNLTASPIDRDAAWKTKMEALEVIYASGRSRSRQRDFERFRAEQGQGLERFALWSALFEKYGPMEDWPEQFKDADSAYVANEARTLTERIDFYAWLQWIIDEQLGRAQKEALDSGMALGLMDDLAVGVHPEGADVWSMPGAFAPGMTVGAPPDMYSQLGQNWSQPPWNPAYLEANAYQPLRDMARTVLRHAGALRIDHIIGLFRLWWIPEGLGADQGVYVRYNHEAMVGVLLLEAYRAGAVLIGEDLGTVEPWVRDYLSSRGILGTAVLWFEQEEDAWPKQPETYRRLALATVTTHDLPPTAGYLAEEHVTLREKLGLLTEPVEEVRMAARKEREHMLTRLREHGLLGEEPSEREIVEALHRYIARTPSALLAVSLVDGVGERRTQNQPGTDTEYPNWRQPLADGLGDVVLVEDLPGNARLQSLLAAVRESVKGK